MERLKTIVHVSYYFHPEMGYDINLIGKYHSKDFNYVIITSDILTPWNTTCTEMIAADKNFENEHGVKLIRCPSIAPRGKHSVYIKGLRKSIIAEKPDLVFFHGIEAYTYCYSLLTLPRSIKIFGDTHTLRSQFAHMSIFGKCLYFLFKSLVVPRINKDPNLFFYTAPENKEILIEDFGIDSERVFDNEISIDPNLFYEKEPNLSLMPGLDKSNLTIGYVGKFDSYKEPHLILEALKLLKLDMKLNLLFIGPRDVGYMEEKWDESGLNANINIVHEGSVKNQELVVYYALFDFLIIPKFNSLSSLDIQACGKPLVMVNDTTNALRCKVGGLLYKEGDLESLSSKISELIENDKLRLTLGINGKNYITSNYSYPIKLKAIEALY